MRTTMIAAVAAAGLALAGGMQAAHADSGTGHDARSDVATTIAAKARAAKAVTARPVALRQGIEPGTKWGRIEGANRYETSASMSETFWQDDLLKDYSKIVFVATGTGFADGLAAGAAAVPVLSPVILVPTTGTLPAATSAELTRLKPEHIFVVGGTPSVSAAIEQQLGAFLPSGSKPARIAGANRYDTAAQLAEVYEETGKTVYLASGETFADALPASAIAGKAGAPLLLTKRGALPKETVAQLKRLAPKNVVVVGGTPTIAETVVSQVKSTVGGVSVSRIAGASRYGTAVNLSQANYTTAESAFLVSGEKFPDALSASAVSGLGMPMLMTRQRCLPKETDGELTRLKTSGVVLVGGETSVSERVLDTTC